MKYANETEMSLAHLHDAIDTTGGMYEDVANALFGTLLHAMVRIHGSDMEKVALDIEKLSAHYAARCRAVAAEDVAPGRVLN